MIDIKESFRVIYMIFRFFKNKKKINMFVICKKIFKIIRKNLIIIVFGEWKWKVR